MREQELRAYLNRILWGSLGLGALVAVRRRACASASSRCGPRSSTSGRSRRKEEMRRLSQRLVSAQEDERRRLARELHDEVGQMLTALRMELGKAERVAPNGGAGFAASVAECKRIIDTVMESVRAPLHGPAPGDARRFRPGQRARLARRGTSRVATTCPVFLAVEGDLDRLPEPQRTCVYRVVQEALTNCAKHAAGHTGRRESCATATAACTSSVQRRRRRHGDGDRARGRAWGWWASRSACARSTASSRSAPSPAAGTTLRDRHSRSRRGKRRSP